MPQLAYSALTAVIFTSAAGALVMCVLVFKYGFSPHPDELPSAAVRRVFITRLGHALAGTCFATSAILAAVTLADIAGIARPTAAPDDRVARDHRLAALTSRVSVAESRLQRTDERVRRVEAGLHTVDAGVRRTAPREDQPTRAVVTPPPAPVVVESRPAVTVSAKPKAVVSPAASVAPSRPPARKPAASDDLGSRMRREWESIKRGFATAGTKFRAALDEQTRTVRGD
jgi:hypothetical protein